MRVKRALMATCAGYMQVLGIQAWKRLSLNWRLQWLRKETGT
ncbi:hypothetical protein ACV3RS_17015 [Clostridium perfringens]